MPKDIPARDIIRVMGRFGFQIHKQTGAHIKFKNGTGKTVPMPHQRLIKGTTLGDIIKMAGVDKESFLALL